MHSAEAVFWLFKPKTTDCSHEYRWNPSIRKLRAGRSACCAIDPSQRPTGWCRILTAVERSHSLFRVLAVRREKWRTRRKSAKSTHFSHRAAAAY